MVVINERIEQRPAWWEQQSEAKGQSWSTMDKFSQRPSLGLTTRLGLWPLHSHNQQHSEQSSTEPLWVSVAFITLPILANLMGILGFPDGSAVKKSLWNAGDSGSTSLIPGLGRSPGEGNGNSLQYSYWKIPWTEESSGLQSMRSQRVGHYLSNWAHMGILEGPFR